MADEKAEVEGDDGIMDALDTEGGAGDSPEAEAAAPSTQPSRADRRVTKLVGENRDLRERLARLEGRVEAGTAKTRETPPEDPDEARIWHLQRKMEEIQANQERLSAWQVQKLAEENQQRTAAAAMKGLKWVDPDFAQFQVSMYLKANPGADPEAVRDYAEGLVQRLAGGAQKGKREAAAYAEEKRKDAQTTARPSTAAPVPTARGGAPAAPKSAEELKAQIRERAAARFAAGR